jgi:pSer/pThr/pTyr-binding forkhead associated (FHA) protein
MKRVTLRVLDGADRGRLFEDLSAPVTVGREEGNSVQLNDERISRFHFKIQEDLEQLVLTDLESTNGTRVNGEDVKLRILQFGDVITLGRSVLLYGTREQISQRLEELRHEGLSSSGMRAAEEMANRLDSESLSFELKLGASEDIQGTLHIPLPPSLPQKLSPGQAAQVSQLLEYLHLRVRLVVQGAAMDEEHARVHLSQETWQEMLDVQAHLAEYLRQIGNPNSS